jgi:hypothetical protein
MARVRPVDATAARRETRPLPMSGPGAPPRSAAESDATDALCAVASIERGTVMRRFLAGLFVLGLAAGASAQQNAIDGLDIEMHSIRNATALAARDLPSGVNGISFETTAATPARSRQEGADAPAPPFLSSWSRASRTAASSRSPTAATSSTPSPPRTSACSQRQQRLERPDRLLRHLRHQPNGDRHWLARSRSSTLARHRRACSYRDHGDPNVGRLDCDGVRSLDFAQIAAFDNVKNRCQVSDADLGDASASYYLPAPT